MTTVQHVKRLSSMTDPTMEARLAALAARLDELAARETEREAQIATRLAHLERQVAGIVEAQSAGWGVMHRVRWSPRAYSRMSRLGELEQKRVLAELAARQVTVVMPADLVDVLGEEQ